MAEPMVLDSSIAAKWFLKDEGDTDLAEEILLGVLAGDIEGHVPRVFFYEVCHVLTKACQTRPRAGGSPRITSQQAADGVREFWRLSLVVHEPTEAAGVEALEMAVQHSKTHADMIFVCLAIQLDCRWCTADEKVLAANRPTFPLNRVLLLSSMRNS